jgi:hypothetical protein
VPNYTLVIPSPQASLAWTLLREGVPISLLCDLLDPDGPPSRQILAAEAFADDVRRSHPAGGSIAPPEVTISSA